MTRKSNYPFSRMLTLYQKLVAYSVLILLLTNGWGCETTYVPGKKSKVTVVPYPEKPGTKTSTTARSKKVLIKEPGMKDTLLGQQEDTADQHTNNNTPNSQSAENRSDSSNITATSEVSTPDPQLDLEFAIEQFKANQFEVAEYYLKKSLMASPDNPTIIRFLPWAYFFQKRYDKALVSFESAHTHFPKDAEPLIGMGWSYVAMKFYERALEKFKQAESLSPDSHEVNKGLGFCNLFLAKEKAAQYHFKKIYLFGERDDLEDQWDQWRQGLPDKPVEVAPSHIRTASLFTLDIEAPRYRSMLSVYPDYRPEQHPALEDAWRLYRKKLFARALAAFQSLPQEITHNLDARNGLAWSLLKTGNLIEAEKIFNETWRQSGRFIGTHLGILEVKKTLQAKASIAKHYYDIHKYRIAEEKFTQLNQSYPNWSYPHSALGWIALKRSQENEALKRFETALDKDP
ncbi:MAG: hypothetical protein OET63_21510, partial [Desulfobacterales bacterium]|nr:hypothetical protein [Desulfobacterales bacterium]